MIDIVEKMEIELYAEEQPVYDRPFPSLPRESMGLELFDIFEENAEYAAGYVGMISRSNRKAYRMGSWRNSYGGRALAPATPASPVCS